MKQPLPRKTVLYTGVLAVLILVFVVQETTETRRNAIPLPDIVEEVDQIRIESATEALAFQRTDAGWVLGENAYPVNPDTMEAILETVEALDAVDVVTDRGDAEDYGLDASSRRTLRLFTGDLEPLALQLGDSAAAGNAVYGRVNTSDEIVLLPVSLDTAVAIDPFRYREKTMAAIPEDSIVAVRIESPRFETVTVQRKIEDATDDGGDNSAGSPSGSNGGDSAAGSTAADSTVTDSNAAPASQHSVPVETEWEATGVGTGGSDELSSEGSADAAGEASAVARDVDPARLNALIRELAAVEATGFPEYDPVASDETGSGSASGGSASGGSAGEDTAYSAFDEEPFATIAVERNNGDIVTIDLWPPDGARRIPAVSSETDRRFYIPEWRARRLLLGLNRYLDPYTVEEDG